MDNLPDARRQVSRGYPVSQGAVTFPKKPLSTLAVHYSDTSMPYGPFTVGEGMRLAVVRNREAQQYYMHDPVGRKPANGRGREFYGEASTISWENVPGSPAVSVEIGAAYPDRVQTIALS